MLTYLISGVLEFFFTKFVYDKERGRKGRREGWGEEEREYIPPYYRAVEHGGHRALVARLVLSLGAVKPVVLT